MDQGSDIPHSSKILTIQQSITRGVQIALPSLFLDIWEWLYLWCYFYSAFSLSVGKAFSFRLMQKMTGFHLRPSLVDSVFMQSVGLMKNRSNPA